LASIYYSELHISTTFEVVENLLHYYHIQDRHDVNLITNIEGL